MKDWMWWAVGAVVLYVTRNTWMPWLGLGPGKLPEVGNVGSKSGSRYVNPKETIGRPPPPASGAAKNKA